MLRFVAKNEPVKVVTSPYELVQTPPVDPAMLQVLITPPREASASAPKLYVGSSLPGAPVGRLPEQN